MIEASGVYLEESEQGTANANRREGNRYGA